MIQQVQILILTFGIGKLNYKEFYANQVFGKQLPDNVSRDCRRRGTLWDGH